MGSSGSRYWWMEERWLSSQPDIDTDTREKGEASQGPPQRQHIGYFFLGMGVGMCFHSFMSYSSAFGVELCTFYTV